MKALHVATTINSRFDHVTPIESTRSEVTITHRCHLIAELLAVARSGLVDVVLVADDFEMLTLELLHQLADSNGYGPKVVAISDVTEDRQRLAGMGIPVASPQLTGPELVDWLQDAYAHISEPEEPASAFSTEELQFLASVDPDSIAPTVTQAVESPNPQRRSGRRAAPYDPAHDIPKDAGDDGDVVDQPTWLPTESLEETDTPAFAASEHGSASETISEADSHDAHQTPAGHPVASEENYPLGQMAAIWGPIGSPGVTTVAVNLAVESALAGHRTLLIDANTYGAAIAVHLGLLDDTAGIAQACRAAEHRGIDAASLSGLAQHVTVQGTSLEVLTGLTRPERWPQLRARAWEQVLAAAREGWDQVIIDCGFGLEKDEELSFDIPAPQRNATTVTAVSVVDTVVAVGTGDAVGFARFMKTLDELANITTASVVPVVNKVTSMTSGMSPKQQLYGVWERFGPSTPLQYFIPWSAETASAAIMAGKSLAESAPKSDLRQSIRKLMVACAPAGMRADIETSHAKAPESKISKLATTLKQRVRRRKHGAVQP